MDPFTITIYEKNTYKATMLRFYYLDGTAHAWTLPGLRNGGHESNSYSDTFSDEYTHYEGDEAQAVAREYLAALLNI